MRLLARSRSLDHCSEIFERSESFPTPATIFSFRFHGLSGMHAQYLMQI